MIKEVILLSQFYPFSSCKLVERNCCYLIMKHHLLADETTFSRHLFLENLINCEAKLVVHEIKA